MRSQLVGCHLLAYREPIDPPLLTRAVRTTLLVHEGRMSKGGCSRLDSDGITQVDKFDPAECTMLVGIDDNVVGFDIYSPALIKPW